MKHAYLAKSAARQAHEVSLSVRELQCFEELFWVVVVCRQILTVQRRANRDETIPLMSRQYLGLSVGQCLQYYDWEEPQCFNSSWHARRVRCAESVFKAAVAHWPVAEVNGEVLLFLA